MKRRTLLGGPAALWATAALPIARAQSANPAVWRLEPQPVHDGLGSPVGTGYDRTGHLYVANWSAGTVLRF